MAHILLDASALLAVVSEESGAEIVQEALHGDVAMSTVNVAEAPRRRTTRITTSEDAQSPTSRRSTSRALH